MVPQGRLNSLFVYTHFDSHCFSFELEAQTSMDRPIARFAYDALGMEILRVYTMLNPVMEEFAQVLWGDDAYRVIHNHMFWHRDGRCYGDSHALTAALEEWSYEVWGWKCNISTYRQLIAGLGKYWTVLNMDPEEEWTSLMDAGAGRSSSTGDRIYGIMAGDLLHFNTKMVQLFKALSNIHHHWFLRLKVKGPIYTIDQIEKAKIYYQTPQTLALHASTSDAAAAAAAAAAPASTACPPLNRSEITQIANEMQPFIMDMFETSMAKMMASFFFFFGLMFTG